MTVGAQQHQPGAADDVPRAQWPGGAHMQRNRNGTVETDTIIRGRADEGRLGVRSDASRRSHSDTVRELLAGLDDEQLQGLVLGAHPLAVGIGGATFRADVLGTPVFIKRISLTDVERESVNVRSTANIHGVPAAFHYGVGSVGVGAWRELEAHLLTDQWVRAGQCDMFPLLHHWRMLGGLDVGPATSEQDDREAMVAYWHGSPAVRQRLAALSAASAGLYLFLEHVPQTLAQWLSATRSQGPDALDRVCDRVAEDLVSTASFMSRRQLVHVDAHFDNIMADGKRIYVTDFGLALSATFVTTADEDRFLREHEDHDVAYVVRELVNWLVSAFAGDADTWTDASHRDDLVRRYADGQAPLPLPPRAAAVVSRYAEVAVVLNGFYASLFGTSRYSSFPWQKLRSACASAGLPRAYPASRDIGGRSDRSGLGRACR